MLEKKEFQTSATLPLLLKKLVSRRALNLILEDLDQGILVR
jgi:hypothetical protein